MSLVGQAVPPGCKSTGIGDRLTLHVAESEDDGYSVYCTSGQAGATVELSLNFKKSSNLELVLSGKLAKGMEVPRMGVPPGAVVLVATLQPKRRGKPCELRYSVGTREVPIDPVQLHADLDRSASRIGAFVEAQLRMQMDLIESEQPHTRESTRGVLAKYGLDSQVDIFFPPVARSIGTADAAFKVIWRRPSERSL